MGFIKFYGSAMYEKVVKGNQFGEIGITQGRDNLLQAFCSGYLLSFLHGYVSFHSNDSLLETVWLSSIWEESEDAEEVHDYRLTSFCMFTSKTWVSPCFENVA
jgi:hypothetical protein